MSRPEPTVHPRELFGRTNPRRWAWLGADLLFLLLLAAAVTWSFVGVYEPGAAGRAGLGGATVGILAGLGLARLGAGASRRPSWLGAPVGVVAYFLCGGVCALPSTTMFGWVPTGRTFTGLAAAAIHAWKTSLSVDPPVGEGGAVLVVPFATLLAAGLAAAWLAFGSTRPLVAWVPFAAAWCVAILFGLHSAASPLPVALVFTFGTLLWSARRRAALRHLRGDKCLVAPGAIPVIGGVMVLVIAGCLATLAAPWLQPGRERIVLRDVVRPPLNVYAWPSPLQRFRADVVDRRDQPLFTIEGLPAGARIRVAALDVWDGTTYHVSNDPSLPDAGTFRRIGDRIPVDSPGEPVTLNVTVNGYAGVWVPTVGRPVSLRFTGQRAVSLRENLYVNPATGTAMTTEGLGPGDSYRLRVIVPSPPSAEAIAEAAAADAILAAPAPVPDALRARATAWISAAGSDAETAELLQARLREGYYSNGVGFPSLPGHSAYRLDRLLGSGLIVGDEEQYAVAMALLARESGLPARVVYGFRPKNSGQVTVLGQDASAWVEIKYAGLGWVPYDPTPPRERTPPLDADRNQSRAQPQANDPPPPPNRPVRIPGGHDEPDPPAESALPRPWIDLRRWGPALAVAGVPLLSILLVSGTILAVKARRRRRRRTTGRKRARIAGAWAEVADHATDLGVVLEDSWTSVERARALVETFPTTINGPGDPHGLARGADAFLFGPAPPTPEFVEKYWREVDAILAGMDREAGPWRRLWAKLSPASLRLPRLKSLTARSGRTLSR